MNLKDIILIITLFISFILIAYLIFETFFKNRSFVIKTESLTSKIKNDGSIDRKGEVNDTNQNNIDSKEMDAINRNKGNKITLNNIKDYFQSLSDKYQNINNPDNIDNNRYNVLIVDDSNLSLIAAITALNEEHELFNITTAINGLDAWTKIIKNKPDIIITDIDMPKWNGEMLIDKIKSSFPLSDIPIIVMTSNIQIQYKMFANKSINGFFPKPLDDRTNFRNYIKTILSR